MWVEFRQSLARWFGSGVASSVRAKDFRASDPVLNEFSMSEGSHAGFQVGCVNGSIRVVHLKQERVTHIHVYSEPNMRTATDNNSVFAKDLQDTEGNGSKVKPATSCEAVRESIVQNVNQTKRGDV